MLVTLSLGGASAIPQDAASALRFVHTGPNSLQNDVTSGFVNLHDTLPSNAS